MNDTIDSILAAFERFRMPDTRISEYADKGREALRARFAPFVQHQHPIRFVMLGYPHKSTNRRDKTIGELPDRAEELSFENFRRFGQEMQAVHAPGIRITIASDGFVFNDLLGEPDHTVEAYRDVSRDMARGTPVKIITLDDFYQGKPRKMARWNVMEQFGIDDTALEWRINFDANVNALYRGMIRFMEEELANREYPSGRQRHLAAKSLARKMMFRNEAYSALVSNEFGEDIRLSMHPSTNNGKWGFQLIPGPKSWFSPWHCALLVMNDGAIETVHRKDAEAAGHELVEFGGRPYYFHEK